MGKKWEKLKKTKDTVLKNGNPDDIVITIMGPTGVGKSSFINRFFDQERAIPGHSLKSCTQNIAHYMMILPEDYGLLSGKRLILVDTPGFNDSYEDETEILRRIAVWLSASYSDNMTVSGIIYLNDISQKRMFGSTLMNLTMFQKLCGPESFSKVTMATTHWDAVPHNVAVQREQELRERFWTTTLSKGAVTRRIQKDEDVRDIVEQILLKQERLIKSGAPPTKGLQLQQELVDWERIIPATDAGKELKYSLEQYLKLQKEAEAEGMSEERKRQLEGKKSIVIQQVQELKIPFFWRLRMIFHL